MKAKFSEQHSKIDHRRIPTDIIYHRVSQRLELVYRDQSSVFLDAEYLRVFSPSAEVRGHSPGQAKLQHGKKHVNITGISIQGRYAIQITFDDMHNTGVYTWNYLWELSESAESNWDKYLNDLVSNGLGREPF